MKAFWIGLTLLILFILAVWGAHHRLWGFYLNREVKPVDLAILAVNLFIALFLSQFILDKAGNLRAEKDLLISNVQEVLKELRTSREALIACQESQKITKSDKTSILAVVRRIANGLIVLESALQKSQCSSLRNDCENITDAYVSYKKSATGGHFPKPFAQDQISEQERAYRKLVERLHELLFGINRYPA
jgi:hypothetical protein